MSNGGSQLSASGRPGDGSVDGQGKGSHGRLGRFAASHNPVLRRFPIDELASAMLARLDGDAKMAYAEMMRQHHLFDELQGALAAALDVGSNRFSPTSVAGMMHFVRHCRVHHGLPVDGASHADMGCGSLTPLGRMFSQIMLGVERAYAFDLDPPQNLPRATRHLAELASVALLDPSRLFPGWEVLRHDNLDRLIDFDLARLQRGDSSGIPSRLQFMQRSILDTGLEDGSMDVLFSNSVMEHVAPLDELMQEWRRITAPGGYGVHGIDMADHRTYGNPAVHPLQFLEEPEGPAILHECNRKRWPDFQEMFTRHGFDIVEAWPLTPSVVDRAVQARFAEPWRSMKPDDVSITWVQVLVRRR